MRKIFTILFLFANCTFFAKADTYDPFTQSKFVVWRQGFGENTVVRMPASAQQTAIQMFGVYRRHPLDYRSALEPMRQVSYHIEV